MSVTTTVRRRFSAAEHAFVDDQHQLMAYLNDRLPRTDWRRTDWRHTNNLVCETWLEALNGHDAEADEPEEEGLPRWLAAAARRVIARHTHPMPSRDVRWELLTQVLGHTSTWPESWHEALVRGGQDELLRTAAADLASDEDEHQEPVAGRVVPLPSAMPRRSAAIAA